MKLQYLEKTHTILVETYKHRKSPDRDSNQQLSHYEVTMLLAQLSTSCIIISLLLTLKYLKYIFTEHEYYSSELMEATSHFWANETMEENSYYC